VRCIHALARCCALRLGLWPLLPIAPGTGFAALIEDASLYNIFNSFPSERAFVKSLTNPQIHKHNKYDTDPNIPT
jgi:hypothetical protein